MPVTEPDIAISIVIQDGCGGLELTDSTGVYPTKSEGYGLPSGPTVNNVTGVTISNTYSSLGSAVLYTFTIVNGTITAATISIGGGSSTNILSALDSTVWPFVSFDMTKNYGVTLPDFEDDIYNIVYTITGTSPGTFSFNESEVVPVECQTTCCRDKKFIDLDPACNCDKEAIVDALYLDALLKQAFYNASYGYLDEAITALNKAKEICADNCGC